VASGVPVIAVDRALDPTHIRSVVSDDQQAGSLLTATLLSPPPRHIALIGARGELPISQARERGFRQALDGFAGRISVRHAEQFSRAGGCQQMHALLADPAGMPDALITTAYVLLEGVLDALQAQTAENFSDLRLATFGDTQLLDFLPLRVNAISQQHAQIAERVLALAIAAIEQNHYQPGIEAIARQLKVRRTP
jgi:LacI family fructose operon transcriptional repressor